MKRYNTKSQEQCGIWSIIDKPINIPSESIRHVCQKHPAAMRVKPVASLSLESGSPTSDQWIHQPVTGKRSGMKGLWQAWMHQKHKDMKNVRHKTLKPSETHVADLFSHGSPYAALSALVRSEGHLFGPDQWLRFRSRWPPPRSFGKRPTNGQMASNPMAKCQKNCAKQSNLQQGNKDSLQRTLQICNALQSQHTNFHTQ